MILRRASTYAGKLDLSPRAFVGALAVLLISLPAVAAPRPASRQTSSRGGDDPFAVYEASLNEAASRTLQSIAQSKSSTSVGQTSQQAKTAGAPIAAPAHDPRAGWQRVERLLPVLEPILRQVGVPEQLAAVVLVESGGDPTALSPKGARGLWQLMPDTARRYGLTVNAETDERLDVLKSTRAAAEYLRDLYAEFHDWKLTLAAYNAGEQAVQQAMARTGGTAFSAAAPALPVETQNYVPAVFNALARFGNDTLDAPTEGARLEQAVYATGAK